MRLLLSLRTRRQVPRIVLFELRPHRHLQVDRAHKGRVHAHSHGVRRRRPRGLAQERVDLLYVVEGALFAFWATHGSSSAWVLGLSSNIDAIKFLHSASVDIASPAARSGTARKSPVNGAFTGLGFMAASSTSSPSLTSAKGRRSGLYAKWE